MSDEQPKPDEPQPWAGGTTPPPPPYQAPQAPYQAPPQPAYQAPQAPYQAPPQPTYSTPMAPQTAYAPQPGYPPAGGQGYGAPAPASNPGQVLGIVGIVLGVLMLWVIGLVLSIMSMARSGKAGASKTLGIVGLVINILAAVLSVILTLAVFLPIFNAARDAAEAATALPTAEATLTAEPTADTSTEAAAPTADEGTGEDGDGAIVTLAQTYTIGGLGHGYWALDAATTPAGYNLTTFDEEGVNEFTQTSDSAAWLTTYQGQDPAYAGMTDAEGSTAVLADLLDITVEEVTAQAGTLAVPSAFSGPALELAMASADNGEQAMTAAARIFSDGHYLVLTYLAPSGSYDPADWETLVSMVSVDDSGT